MANNDKENKIEKFTKEAIGKTLNQFNKEIGIADLVEINKNQDRILNGILSQVNDENTEKTEKSNIITLDNSTDGIVELKEIQGDTNVNVSRIEEMPITHDIGEKEGNAISLDDITEGAINIDNIQGNTMVNCNKEADKELILMEDLSTEGYSNITLNKGVDGGLVDVALEGNTMVNVCDQKEPIAVTKSYTVENSGNHVALQGEYDGKCRPVATGKTLVNLASNSNLWEVGCSGDVNTDYTITSVDDQGIVVNKLTDNVSYLYLRKKINPKLFKPSTTYTIIFNGSKVNRVGIVSGNTAETVIPLSPCNEGYNIMVLTSTGLSSVTYKNIIYVYAGIEKTYIGTVGASDFIVLEGDYTNKPIPDYFDGLQSSFEDRVVPERLAHFPSTILTTPSSGYTHREFGDTLSLKPSTTYTIVQKAYKTANHSPVNTNAHPYTLVFGGRQGVSDSWIVRATPPVGDIKEGVSVYTLTTPNDFVISIQTFIVIVEENKGSEFELEVSIFEGDYTNYNFSDYDPTKVGKYRVDYKVTGKNKAYGLKQQIPDVLTTKINVTKGKSYTYSTQNIADGTCRISICDSEPYNNESLSNAEIQLISDWGGGNHTWVSEVTGTVWFIIWQRDITINSNSTLQIEEGTTSTSYEPYKEYTKTLYLNSPLLEGDTIEQYGNNIVHVHRYSKVVLDGSASPWGNKWWESTSNTTDTVFSGGLSSAPYEDIGYCDKLLIVAPSNLSSYDTAITIDGESIIRVNIPKELLSGDKNLSAFRTWLNANPITFVGKLKTPTYELIEQSNLAIPSYANGHLDLSSAVPISKVNFLHFEEELTYLYPSTSYTIQFISDKAITVDITLGGTKLLAQSIVKGLNRISITTPGTLADNKLVISGVGANISDVVVTDTDREFKYFEGMKSVGECEELEVVSSNKNEINLPSHTYSFEGTTFQSYSVILPIMRKTFSYRYDYEIISISEEQDSFFTNLAGSGNYDPSRLSMDFDMSTVNQRLYNGAKGTVVVNNVSNSVVHTLMDIRCIRTKTPVTITYKITNFALYFSDNADTYVPYLENKQQLTHEPLRAVGDAKDRYVLIDGKWYIERNCRQENMSELKFAGDTRDTMKCLILFKSKPKAISNIFSNSRGYESATKGQMYVQERGDGMTYLWIPTDPMSRDEFTSFLNEKNATIVYAKAEPTYEPINYTPLEVYSDTTHITTNSTIPCNMTIKNTGFNCLLKPSTTYTVSSNLGLSTITTPSTLTEDCLRFYDTDTSTVTTMNNVTVLEGDYTTGKPIPSHFAGIESAFEQEYDEAVGKYKVKAKVVGKNLSNPNGDFIPVEPSTAYTLSNISDRVFHRQFDRNKIQLCAYKLSNNTTITTDPSCYYIKIDNPTSNIQLEQGTQATPYEPYKESIIEFYINEPLRGIGNVKDRVYIKDDKVVVQRNIGAKRLTSEDVIEYKDLTNVSPNAKPNVRIIRFSIPNLKPSWGGLTTLCNKLKTGKIGKLDETAIEHIYWGTEYNWIACDDKNNPCVGMTADKTLLPSDDIEGARQYINNEDIELVYQLASPTYEEVEYSSNRLILNTFNNESFNNSTLFLGTTILPKLSFKPLYEELVYVKNSTKYYIQFNAVGSGEVVINLGGTELTTEIVEGYNCIPITTPSESTNLMTIIGQGITISEVVVSEVICGGYYKGLQSCFEEHMENGKYRILLRGIALDGSKVNGIKLYINEPLRGIGDIKDRLCIKDGKLMVERKCGEVILDGSDDENWIYYKSSSSNPITTTSFRIDVDNVPMFNMNLLCDKLDTINLDNMYSGKYGVCTGKSNADRIYISIDVEKLSTQDVNVLKQYLQQNQITVVYQLAQITYEEATNEYGLPIVLEGYESGIVYVDSAVTPTTSIKYTSNNILATTLSKAEEQNIATQEDINMNVVTYMMDIDMILTEMEMSNDTSVMAVRRDSSNENMLDRMSEEDKKVYRDNTVVMLEKMITANVLEKEDIEGRINMYYNKNRISKEQYEYLKSLL